MNYVIILDEGVVELDGVQIAPCQSPDDPAFVAYIQWVEAGNQPLELPTRG